MVIKVEAGNTVELYLITRGELRPWFRPLHDCGNPFWQLGSQCLSASPPTL